MTTLYPLQQFIPQEERHLKVQLILHPPGEGAGGSPGHLGLLLLGTRSHRFLLGVALLLMSGINDNDLIPVLPGANIKDVSSLVSLSGVKYAISRQARLTLFRPVLCCQRAYHHIPGRQCLRIGG